MKKSEVAQSCPTLCGPMDCSLPGSSVHVIFQARVLEWVATSFSRGSSQPWNRTQVSHIAGRCFTIWTNREAIKKFFFNQSIWLSDTAGWLAQFPFSIQFFLASFQPKIDTWQNSGPWNISRSCGISFAFWNKCYFSIWKEPRHPPNSHPNSPHQVRKDLLTVICETLNFHQQLPN